MAIVSSERQGTRRRQRKTVPPGVLERALARTEEVREAIDTLINEGIPSTDIAAGLGCSRWEVWAWRTSRYEPRAPIMCFVLLEWAAHVRAHRAAAPILRAMAQLQKNAREEGNKNASTETGHSGV